MNNSIKPENCFTPLFILIWLAMNVSNVISQYQQTICGKLNEQYLYNDFTDYTAIDEHPWIGRISYSTEPNKRSYTCLAVLISKRSMLTVAHCVSSDLDAQQPVSVILGDWHASDDVKTVDCNEAKVCSLPPQDISIAEIAVHPSYGGFTKGIDNDIAVLVLAQDVEFNDYVQPICLPGTFESKQLSAQHFHFVGYPRLPNSFKQKSLVYTTSRERCAAVYRFRQRIKISQNQICAYNKIDFNMMSGSAMIGVNVVNDKPQNFDLVGILSSDTFNSTMEHRYPVIFMLISPYKDWIRRNML